MGFPNASQDIGAQSKPKLTQRFHKTPPNDNDKEGSAKRGDQNEEWNFRNGRLSSF
jgi:hypothetical protein